MPDLRAQINPQEVLMLLHQHSSQPVANLVEYEERKVELHFYQQHLLCYECYIALSAMRFFAAKGSESSYQWVRSRIRQELEASPHKSRRSVVDIRVPRGYALTNGVVRGDSPLAGCGMFPL